MDGSQSADIFVSVVSPLLGLILVALVFWVDRITEEAPLVIGVLIGFVFIATWAFGMRILLQAIEKYRAAGVISGSDHITILIFLISATLLVVVLLGSGIYYSS